jgi:hypothetical protein
VQVGRSWLEVLSIRRLELLLSAGRRGSCRPLQKLDRFLSRLTQLRDLVRMNIKLLGKFGEGRLSFESRAMISAWSSGHGSSSVLGRIANLQAEMSPNHAVQISRSTSVHHDDFDTKLLSLPNGFICDPKQVARVESAAGLEASS